MAAAGGDKKMTACVTGGNGYIASALIKMLLEKGYAVKTTVRNPGSILPYFTSVQCSVANPVPFPAQRENYECSRIILV